MERLRHVRSENATGTTSAFILSCDISESSKRRWRGHFPPKTSYLGCEEPKLSDIAPYCIEYRPLVHEQTNGEGEIELQVFGPQSTFAKFEKSSQSNAGLLDGLQSSASNFGRSKSLIDSLSAIADAMSHCEELLTCEDQIFKMGPYLHICRTLHASLNHPNIGGHSHGSQRLTATVSAAPRL